MDRDTALAYHRMAPRYDQRWRHYMKETLDRACRYVEGSGPLRLLDVGCGTGEFTRQLASRLPEATFVGVDPAPGMIEQTQRKLAEVGRVYFQCASAEELPFPDETFDWVTSCSSLHCFRDARESVRQMVRVLKPKGRLLVMDWCRSSTACRLLNRWCSWFDPTHVWMYSIEELRQMFEQTGCVIRRLDRFRVPWPGSLKLWEMMACVAMKL